MTRQTTVLPPGIGVTWLQDVRAALRVWQATPALPVVALLIAVAAFAPQLVLPQPNSCGLAGHPACTSGNRGLFTLLSVLAFPVSLFTVGFFGAERWWYAQVNDGNIPPNGLLWGLSWSYFWRFVRLGLLIFAVSAPLLLPFALSVRHDQVKLSLVFGVWGVALDIALTFVTPAMALSTSSAWQAFKLGVRTLDLLWPRDLPYALVPPLAITIIARAVPDLLGSRALTACAGGAAQMLTMLFAGATAILYVREIEPTAPERLRQGPPAKPAAGPPQQWS